MQEIEVLKDELGKFQGSLDGFDFLKILPDRRKQD